MGNEIRILCGEEIDSSIAPPDAQTLRLHLYGDDSEHKIRLTIEQLEGRMFKEVPDRFRDLLDLATYVYAADQAVKRGSRDVETFGENWRRAMRFEMPVRDLDFWSSETTQRLVEDTLGFLSDDSYQFVFRRLMARTSFQTLLEFNDHGQMLNCPEQVMLFSGGLDSLGGAVDEVLNQRRRLVLVNHRATQKLDRRYRDIADLLATKAGANAPIHLRVTVNKKAWMNQEYTQRTRSFLFAALASTISAMLDLKSIRFYENGVISLNLPVCAQVVGGKATRTTHPRVLDGYRRLLSLVAEAPFVVENPFIWKTKAEVLGLLAGASCQDLIRYSTSCSHIWEMTNDHAHCGMCSQCIDRRFAIIASGLEEQDPLGQYKLDCFTMSRGDAHQIGEDKTMLASYVERSNQVERLRNPMAFLKRYPEVLRAIPFLGDNRDANAERCLDLYRRHAKEVTKALDVMLARHGSAIRQRTLPADCLLRIVYESNLPMSVPAVLAAQDMLPDNVFRRCGHGWQVRFDGQKPFIVLPCLGVNYLHDLLGNRDEHRQVVDVASSAAMGHAADAISMHEALREGLSSAGNPLMARLSKVSDWPAVQAYRRRLEELRAELAEANAEGNRIVADETESEISRITAHLHQILGLGGRLREARDPHKTARDAFRNAINRVIDKQIRETDARLADHLAAQISYRKGPIYTSLGRVWATDPVKAS